MLELEDLDFDFQGSFVFPCSCQPTGTKEADVGRRSAACVLSTQHRAAPDPADGRLPKLRGGAGPFE